MKQAGFSSVAMLKKEWNNSCGLGIGPVTNSLNGVDSSKVYIVDYIAKDGTAKQGIAFYSIESGVEAHLQHLISYTKKRYCDKKQLHKYLRQSFTGSKI